MGHFDERWLLLLGLIPIIWWTLRARARARANTLLLIDSVVQNSLSNLGYKPDAPSLAFLAGHPFLSSKIWKMLGEGGAISRVGGITSEETTASCEKLLPYVQDMAFRERYPCAGALMQYAVYLCDQSPIQFCQHPKDERDAKIS
jgi:hypothetical protein